MELSDSEEDVEVEDVTKEPSVVAKEPTVVAEEPIVRLSYIYFGIVFVCS